MTKKTSLVTGGAGFIGSHLCERLLKEGHRVICIDNFSSAKKGNLEILTENPDFSFYHLNVNNHEEMNKIFNIKFDYVFHYAAIVGVKRTEEKPFEVFQDINGIKNILELSCKNKVTKVIFSSSSEVYGDPVELPESEEGPVNAKTPYSITKAIGEQMMQLYHKHHGLPTTSLRFFNVYGPMQESSDYGFVVGIFVKQALSGKPITIFGDGNNTRDFVYIDDNISAALATLENPATDGEIINVGTGKPTAIIDLADQIAKIVGCERKYEFLEPRKHDIKHRWPDVAKMKKLLNYRPNTSLEDGLRKTIEWYKNGK